MESIAGKPQSTCGGARIPIQADSSTLPSMGISALDPPFQAISDVVLRDGSTMRFRPPELGDAPALLEFFRTLSDRSVYLRFHGHPAIDERLVEPVLEPDWLERGALLGMEGDRIASLANYVRLRNAGTAEVAFAVADDLQGRGIATRMLERLAALANLVGIEEFVAEVMPDNSSMLRVFAEAGFDTSRSTEGGSTEVRLRLAPTDVLVSRIDERDHLAVAASLEPFFSPASVAVIGASSRSGSVGGELFRNILRGDFVGAAYPVNRSGDSVAGVRAYRSMAEIGEPVDLAVVCLPGDTVLEAAAEALRAGVRALCVISAGFAETGPDGRERQDRLVALVRARGARLLGPNCLGIAVSEARLNATFGPNALPEGNVGFSSQSGALGLALLERAAERGLGLSAFVSVGNKADVSSNDLLEYWEDDPKTDVVLLYLESFGNPRKFGRVARRVARKKPIVAMKAGRTAAGARAASSHTAALAGSEAAVDALFHQAGVLRADTLEELLDLTSLLAAQPLPRGNRVAILTNAGGLGILCADACEAAGLSLPELSEETIERIASILPPEASVTNPVDMLGSAVASAYSEVLPILLRDHTVDAVIALFVPPVMAGADEIAAAIVRSVEEAAVDEKPVLTCVISADGTPAQLLSGIVAPFSYPESAARALGHAAERAEWLRRPQGRVPKLGDIDRRAARELVEGSSEGWLDPGVTRRLLAAYGLPLVSERRVATVDEAVMAAEEVGYPVVVKTAEAGVHKTESGGVAIDLRDSEAVSEAAARIGVPVLVQPMIRGGVELLVGAVQDPVFGPLIALGPGGTLAELLDDASFRLTPLTDYDAQELVHTGKAGILLSGFRGAAPADPKAVEDLLFRVSHLAEDLPELAELDLNPVVAGPGGCVVVDARVRIARPPLTATLKTW
jgi:acetate---CoA ligase (ADP-forming)